MYIWGDLRAMFYLSSDFWTMSKEHPVTWSALPYIFILKGQYNFKIFFASFRVGVNIYLKSFRAGTKGSKVHLEVRPSGQLERFKCSIWPLTWPSPLILHLGWAVRRHSGLPALGRGHMHSVLLKLYWCSLEAVCLFACFAIPSAEGTP